MSRLTGHQINVLLSMKDGCKLHQGWNGKHRLFEPDTRHSSAVNAKAVARLLRDDYIISPTYGVYHLTDKGQRAAEQWLADLDADVPKVIPLLDSGQK